jgi:AraC family transcriptional regulator of adaptative response/methylated-DNA-[protein]-cysteine methyltransferase
MCLIASTERGICNLSFLPENTQDEYITRFFERWKLAEIKHDQAGTTSTRDQVFQFFTNGFSGKLDLHLMGTNYQLKVWEALMSIPSGSLISYGRLADRMGQVNSSRSIGGAVSKNPISLIIPCHRVIYQVGDFGHYQGGDTRKKAILGWEMSRYTS